jgi:hypothetical protein
MALAHPQEMGSSGYAQQCSVHINLLTTSCLDYPTGLRMAGKHTFNDKIDRQRAAGKGEITVRTCKYLLV